MAKDIVGFSNSILESNIDSIICGSRFSRNVVVGSNTIEILRKIFPDFVIKTIKPVYKSMRYFFGAGQPQSPLYQVLVRDKAIGHVRVDVVPGNLPMLVGRRFLKLARAILDFGKDEFKSNSKPWSS